jgi:hypothetical protein
MYSASRYERDRSSYVWRQPSRSPPGGQQAECHWEGIERHGTSRGIRSWHPSTQGVNRELKWWHRRVSSGGVSLAYRGHAAAWDCENQHHRCGHATAGSATNLRNKLSNQSASARMRNPQVRARANVFEVRLVELVRKSS